MGILINKKILRLNSVTLLEIRTQLWISIFKVLILPCALQVNINCLYLPLYSSSEEIIVVSLEPEPNFKKMDTVVKLDSVCISLYLNIVSTL